MIGVMGGTFDPVHIGHLRVALEVKETLGFDEMRLVPCRSPPHRPMPAVSVELRLIMLERAIIDEPGLVIDTRELERSGPSYMVDTLRSMRDEIPGESLGLVLGMDAFVELQNWHQWQELPKLAHFIVMHRPGSVPQMPGFLCRLKGVYYPDRSEALKEYEAGCVFFQEVTPLDISSTVIREIIRSDGNPRFLLPEPVLELIRERGLYQ